MKQLSRSPLHFHFHSIFLLLLLSLLPPPTLSQRNNLCDIDTTLQQSIGIRYDGKCRRITRSRANPTDETYPNPLITVEDIIEVDATYTRTGRPNNEGGTRNFELGETGGVASFSPRNGHATTVHRCPESEITGIDPSKECIWLTGGNSAEYQSFDLSFTTRNSDVWYSLTGKKWYNVNELKGDYLDGIGNFDAKYPGPVAPWYARYGHTLEAMDATGDGVNDAMMLFGGYAPDPSNDVWISTDGETWAYDGEAPFSRRGWAATQIYRGVLYVVGGAPLSNDVWVGEMKMKDSAFVLGGVFNHSRHSGYDVTMSWTQKVAHMDGGTPFSPRSGHCLATQLRRDNYTATGVDGDGEAVGDETVTDRMFLIGGFASWPLEDPRHDGERTRNDVYVTADGSNWEKVPAPFVEGSTEVRQRSHPFGGRGWHGCATFHDPSDRMLDVSGAAKFSHEITGSAGEDVLWPRIFVAGGGYIGNKQNRVVSRMEGYVDMWWTRNGIDWHQVSYIESKGATLFTTQNWARTSIEGRDVNLGKWGMTMLAFNKQEDLNANGVLDSEDVFFEFGGTRLTSENSDQIMLWHPVNGSETNVPALIMIAGDTVDSGSLVSDVYISSPGLLCELDGSTCSNRGTCGPGVTGCVCDSLFYIGEYCENFNDDIAAAEGGGRVRWGMLLVCVIGLGGLFV